MTHYQEVLGLSPTPCKPWVRLPFVERRLKMSSGIWSSVRVDDVHYTPVYVKLKESFTKLQVAWVKPAAACRSKFGVLITKSSH